MRPRPGYTLVECLIAIGLMATTFTTVAVALHGVSCCQERIRDDLRTELAWNQFAAQFRADAHQATKAQLGQSQVPNQQAQTLLLTLSEHETAQYALKPGHIERTVNRQGKIQHREAYTLGASLRPRWQVAADGAWPLASLVLESEPGGSPGPLSLAPLRVDAAVGLLHPRSGPTKP